MTREKDDRFDTAKGEVGYGRPPKEHRIKPGEIRNPNGRKGKAGPKDFLEEHIFVCSDGKRCKVSREKALDLALFQEACKGNVSAAKELKRRQRERKLETAANETQNVLQPGDQETLDRFIQRRLKELEAAQDPPLKASLTTASRRTK